MFIRKNKVFLGIIAMLFVLFFSLGCQHIENEENNNSNESDVMEESLGGNLESEQEMSPEESAMEEASQILENKKENVPAAPKIVFEDLEWKTYHNNLLGYSLDYPTILDIRGEDLDQHVELTGPLYQNEWWPRIEISHYSSSFYRPTGEDIEVSEWVRPFPEYTLLEDYTIADLDAIHYVQSKTPQAWGADYFFFIKDNQLYRISIIHSNDRQDWDIYNKILESFMFTDK